MPVLARAFFLLALVMAVVGGTLFGVALRRVRRVHDVPPPPIVRATAAAEIARGSRLFRATCLDCHGETPSPPRAPGGAGERRPLGGRVLGAPSFLGEIWAPNLTADVESGIGAWSDGELARLLRNGLRRDGRYAATMPRFARLADRDVAALIGFLRSADPLVAPVRNDVPRSHLSVAGTLALAYAAGVDTRGDAHVAMPDRTPSAAYGRYLATAVYGCVDCHTEGPGTTEDKLRSPLLLAGGQIHRTPRGDPLYSPNLTPDPDTGLRETTAAALERLLTTGIDGEGLAARPPMPVFRTLDSDEAAALFAYLRSVSPVGRTTPGAGRRERPAADASPDLLFASLGCAVCHGEGAPHKKRLVEAASKNLPGDLAATIRHPEVQHPDSQMPTYASILDEPAALRLALWIQAMGAPHQAGPQPHR